MKKIQMVDLQGQYAKIKETVDASIEEVLNSSAYINGPYVHEFQAALEDYLNVKHVIPCANGTDALQIAMMGLGLEQGDEVITVDFTFAATVEVIALLKLTPVLIDVEPDTFNINIDALKKAITPKTKAIVPVHLFGLCANMDAVMEIAKEHHLWVIEDTAQAIGANYTFIDGKKQKVGTIGDVGTTSFFPSKNLGCYGDGGAIFTNNDELAHTIRGIVNHGMYKRYYHDVVGVHSRLDSIQAAVLKIKLKELDNYIESRRNVAKYYDDAFSSLKGVTIPFRSDESKHVFHQYTLILEGIDRDELNRYLAECNVPSMIYYPVPAHRQKMFQEFNSEDLELPVTDWLTQRVISLPIHTEMEEEQLKHISTSFINYLNKK